MTDLISRHAVLSTDLELVRESLKQGRLAAFPVNPETPLSRPVRRVAFDFDATLAGHSSDEVFSNLGRAVFESHEWDNRLLPAESGVALSFALALQLLRASDEDVVISVITARRGREAWRVMTSLEAWGLFPDSIHFSFDRPKGPIAAAAGCQCLIDDSLKNARSAASCGILGLWLPHGRGGLANPFEGNQD